MQPKQIQLSRNRHLMASYYGSGEVQTSIGSIGNIVPAGYGRLKGFLDIEVTSTRELSALTSVINHGISAIRDPAMASMDIFKNVSRLSVRVIAKERMLEALQHSVRRIGAEVEAKVPFNGSAEYMVYIGFNTPARSIGQSVVEEDEKKEILDAIFKGQAYSNRSPYDRNMLHAVGNGYGDPIVFNGSAAEKLVLLGDKRSVVSELASLMVKTYGGYSFEAAAAVLTNPYTMVAVVPYLEPNGQEQHRIAAMSLMERSTVQISNGRTIGIAELTDTTVREKDRLKKRSGSSEGMGYTLSLAVTTELIAGLACDEGPLPDIVFSESHIGHPSLLKACQMQGRTPVGYLHQHAEVDGILPTFAVMHISEDAISKAHRTVKGLIRQ